MLYGMNKSKRPRDTNKLAKSIVYLATGDAEEESLDEGKDPAAAALGRKGGLKGGEAHAKKINRRIAVRDCKDYNCS